MSSYSIPVSPELAAAARREVFRSHISSLTLQERFQFESDFKRVAAWVGLGCPRIKWREIRSDFIHVADRLRNIVNLTSAESDAMKRLFQESIKPEPDLKAVQILWTAYVEA